MYMVSMSEFKCKGINDDCISCIFCTKKDANNHNDYQSSNLQKKGQFIAKIITINSAQAK